MSAEEEPSVCFGTLHPDGSVTNNRTIKKSAMQACPHFIMVPEHYSDDDTCRCDDAGHKEMKMWGYYWDEKSKQWL